MQDLTNISLDDNADIRVVDSNFDKVKTAIDNVESDISNLREDLADYIGPFNTKADLDAYSGALSNNDWAVVLDDETHSNQCWRYVYNATTSTWLPQFMINETPLTQTQLAALNSGADSTKIAQIAQNTSNIAQNTTDIANNTTNINNKINKTTDIQAIEKITEIPENPSDTTLYILCKAREPFTGLKFTNVSYPGTHYVRYSIVGSLPDIDIECSYDDGATWQTWDGTGAIPLQQGESVCVKNNANTLSLNSSNYFHFYSEYGIEPSGDIMSMINYAPLSEYCFYKLFSDSEITTSPDLTATTLANFCYAEMFMNCSRLTSIKLYYTGNFSDGRFIPFDGWVQYVSSTGTLYYNGSDTTVGIGAIPTGWTVQTF